MLNNCLIFWVLMKQAWEPTLFRNDKSGIRFLCTSQVEGEYDFCMYFMVIPYQRNFGDCIKQKVANKVLNMEELIRGNA